MARPVTAEEQAKRFFAKVQKTEYCWNWLGSAWGGGYGTYRFAKEKKPLLAHRAIWIMTYGAIPKGKCVLHHCDNRKCVNPSHLYLGSKKDNRVDCLKHGRAARGLTPLQVSQIRIVFWDRFKLMVDGLAEAFGIAPRTLKLIVTRKTWRFV